MLRTYPERLRNQDDCSKDVGKDRFWCLQNGHFRVQYMNDNFGSDQYFYMRWKATDRSHSSVSKINLHDRPHMYTHILPPPINVYKENNNSIFSVVLSNNFRIYFIHKITAFFRITPCARVCKWQASNFNDHTWSVSRNGHHIVIRPILVLLRNGMSDFTVSWC